MELQNVLCMNGGTNERSYANNSAVQEAAINKVKPVIEESISDMYSTTSDPETLRIADLGCSSGPNALLALSHIIDVIVQRCCGKKHPNVQIFLNDLWGNDFNSIFMSLPTFYERLYKESGFDYGQCFIGAVPGSFYGRLFPIQSLDFVHSSYSLHWLSRVPEGLENEVGEGVSLNKGNIYLAKTTPPLIIQRYREQFHTDFSLFLHSRSKEVRSGGRMVLTLIGRIDQDPCSDECCSIWKLLSHALRDMASLGKIKIAEVDSFNIPFYTPSMEEIMIALETEGSFHLDRVETMEVNWDANGKDNNKSFLELEDINSQARRISKSMRAATEPLLAAKFGEAIMDDLFLRYAEKVGIHMASQKPANTNLVFSVTKIAQCKDAELMENIEL